MKPLREYDGHMASEIPLGPPNRAAARWVGRAISVPLGLSIVLPPHGLLLGIGGAAYVTFVAGWTAVAMASARRFATENNLAIGALGRGELTKAHEVFVHWAPSAHGRISALARRAAEAMVSLEQAWTEHEATMTGQTLRIMRVVRAFACAAADGPRNQGLVERVLGEMKPRYERELTFLGGTWPEMAAFLAAHRLGG